MKPSHLLPGDWLGDLARDLIAPIYLLRVPIAIGTVVRIRGGRAPLSAILPRMTRFVVGRRITEVDVG